jgi:hypothetical protein
MVENNGKRNCTVAQYISELTAELAQLAAAEHYTDLVCLLEMARLESDRLCGRNLDKRLESARDNIIFLHTRVQ